MAKTKFGKVTYWRQSSPMLARFRLMPHDRYLFPCYKAGQYIALRRDDCRLTKKTVGDGSKFEFVTLLNEDGTPKRGAVTHSYSISSAPYETVEGGYLEFYVILEQDEKGNLGRLTESMFCRMCSPGGDDKLIYYDKIAGNFTLDDRAKGFQNVVMVGTGTGLAPFVSMIKQLHCEARQERTDSVRYTLIHANRTYEELDYREDLLAIEAANKLDFAYIPSVSRPTPRDLGDSKLGKGRANNLLRHILEMSLKEEEDLGKARGGGNDVNLRAAAERAVRPVLPDRLSWKELQQRMDPTTTVILSCGNPYLMVDIQYVAEAHDICLEKEDW